MEDINVHGDINCLFRCLTKIYFNKEDYYLFFRQYVFVFDYILKNYNDILQQFTYIEFNENLIETREYIPKITKNGTYSGELELSILTKILNIFISVYEYQSNIFGEIYKSINLYGTFSDKAKIIILSEFQKNLKHFKILKR